METLATQESASPNTEPELHLLLERDRDDDWRRWRASATASIVAHVTLIEGLLLWRAGPVIGLVFLFWICAWLMERDRAYDWRRWRTSATVSVAAHLILIAGLLWLPPSAIIGLVFLGWVLAWWRERDRSYEWRRWRTPGVVSVAAHLALIAALLLMPESMTTLRVYESKPPPVVTPLYIPTDLTQKDAEQREAQQGTLGRGCHARSSPRAEVAGAASTAETIPAAAPPPPVAKPEPKLVIVEPPKIETPPAQPQPEQIARLASHRPPPPPTSRPNCNWRTPSLHPTGAAQGNQQGNPQARIIDAQYLDRCVDSRPRRRAPVTGTQSVEDVGEISPGAGFGVNLPPSAGRPQSSLELASDPMGADFRPYMRQILADHQAELAGRLSRSGAARDARRGGAAVPDRQRRDCGQGEFFDGIGREGARSGGRRGHQRFQSRCRRFRGNSKATRSSCA